MAILQIVSWGLEKYGFIDLTCLKAMEGQAGVDETSYGGDW